MGILSCRGRDGLDEEFKASCLKVPIGQFKSLIQPANNAEIREQAEAVVKLPPTEAKWEDLYLLEMAIIKLERLDDLRRRAWAVRMEYRNMCIARGCPRHTPPFPPIPSRCVVAAA
jgi:hypothetical protein